MNAVIARYLPEFPPAQLSDPVPSQGPAQARTQLPAQVPVRVPVPGSPRAQDPASQAFGNPWAGLARAPRPAPAPPAESPDAIRVEPVRAAGSPAGSPDGFQPLVAGPSAAEPSLARSPGPLATTPLATTPLVASPLVASPLTAKPSAARRETPEERAALIADAEERGRQQGLAEARQEAEISRLRAADEAEFRLAEARRHWSAAEAEALADGFSAALRALDAALSDRIARLLVPVLTDALRRRAVTELSGALTRLLAEPQAASVRVSGPDDLLAALASRLGPLAAAVSFTPAESAEVQVSADQTVIDTQLGAWTRLIAAAVAET